MMAVSGALHGGRERVLLLDAVGVLDETDEHR